MDESKKEFGSRCRQDLNMEVLWTVDGRKYPGHFVRINREYDPWMNFREVYKKPVLDVKTRVVAICLHCIRK